MDLAENLAAVRRQIDQACDCAGRDPAEVQLLAVSKGHPANAIAELVRAGQLDFGESKVQEAKAKIPLCPSSARWEMIGHLQTNKARDAVHLFPVIQSVDSLRLAEELNKQADKAAKTIRILLEINVVGESSKFGYSPSAVLADLQSLNQLRRLEIHGLMTIAPWSQDPERARPVFRKLAELRKQCEDALGAPLPVLSMGMSGDLGPAIQEGSTQVRVGTSLFGRRTYAKFGQQPDVAGELE
ncbi:MAG: YggS family pyridoxal phosphate-dependent enzyme [Verrucomicrobia bacterium]|nr:YggS family pyridoxal phosphate-dependent enzyme [Verrucomicrobiota bacterium]